MATRSSILPGKFHGQRSLAGYSPRGRKEPDTNEHRHQGGVLLEHTWRRGAPGTAADPARPGHPNTQLWPHWARDLALNTKSILKKIVKNLLCIEKQRLQQELRISRKGKTPLVKANI